MGNKVDNELLGFSYPRKKMCWDLFCSRYSQMFRKRNKKQSQEKSLADGTIGLCSEKSKSDCKHVQKNPAIPDDWAIKLQIKFSGSNIN